MHELLNLIRHQPNIDKAIYNWKFVHRHFVTSNCNAECGGYLDNFKILSIYRLTFNCGFPCAFGLEKLRHTFSHVWFENKRPVGIHHKNLC